MGQLGDFREEFFSLMGLFYKLYCYNQTKLEVLAMLVSMIKKYWILGSLVIAMVPHPFSSLEVLAQSKIFVRPQPQILSQLTAIDYFNRGFAKQKSGDNQGAIADYDQAIKLNPNYAGAYNNRGGSKAELKDYQGAIEDYNQAIQIDKNWGNIVTPIDKNWGDIAILIDKNWGDAGILVAYYNRGVIKAELGDNQGAIADYDQAIKLKPDFAIAYYSRGVFKGKSGDNQGAIADYNQAIKLNPDFAHAYNNRGFIKGKSGDNQGAIADYNQAIKLNPGDANAYYGRGFLYQKLGDNQNAINDYRQAAKLYQQQNNQEWYQNSLDNLKKLGVSNYIPVGI
jgi:tetratricopeptide (TPR) repeat protein